MSNSEMHDPSDLSRIREQLGALELRISAMEAKLENYSGAGTRPKYADEEEEEMVEFSLGIPAERESLIESKIGEFGLAWLGNIVLIFGIIFLTEYIMRLGHPMLSSVVGYGMVISIVGLSYFIRQTFSYMASMFTLFSQFLLFYLTLRLHFFTGNPLIESSGIVITLLLFLVVLQVVIAVVKKSPMYAVVFILLSFGTAILSDTASVLLPLTVIIALGSVILFYLYNWHKQLLLSIFMVYLTLLLWILNNPVMGHPLQGIAAHHNSYLFIGACALIYSLLPLMPNKGKFPESTMFISIMLNGAGFSFLIWILVTLFFSHGYIGIFASIALYCMSLAVILKKFSSWKYPPALYVLYGFVALSITIYGLNGLPRSFFLLSIQSLLVLSLALWFRSKIIVVMNFFLFLILLISYAVTSGEIISTNFSFPVVAFISARIINWQKERLEIKTALIRNTYLVVLFFTMLYACYKTFPSQYITLSWTVTAVVYFLMSIILKNVKYRYMALANVVATAFYLFIVDLARIEFIFRIIAFLFLAVITIIISTFYVRKMKKKQQQDEVTG
jgi:hypothetical protein